MIVAPLNYMLSLYNAQFQLHTECDAACEYALDTM